MREQRWGAVAVRLDGDAHLHVWAPNQHDHPFHVDLSDHIAFVIDRGRGQPEPPEPHWTDRGGTTLMIDLCLGAEGSITLDGDAISGRAAIRLAASGFHALLRASLELERARDAPDEPPASDPASEEPT